MLSVVPNAHAQTVQNDTHSYVYNVAVGNVVDGDKNALKTSLRDAGLYTNKEGRYVLDVKKVNDDYSYVWEDKQNNKETKFSVESEVQSNVGASNAFNTQNKLHEIQDKTSFNEATQTIKSL